MKSPRGKVSYPHLHTSTPDSAGTRARMLSRMSSNATSYMLSYAKHSCCQIMLLSHSGQPHLVLLSHSAPPFCSGILLSHSARSFCSTILPSHAAQPFCEAMLLDHPAQPCCSVILLGRPYWSFCSAILIIPLSHAKQFCATKKKTRQRAISYLVYTFLGTFSMPRRHL